MPTKNLIIDTLRVATLMYATQLFAAPSIDQTENYIKEQLLSGTDIISADVSCEEISTKYYNFRQAVRNESFAPKKVKYIAENNEDGKEIVTARCINERCISHFDENGDPTTKSGYAVLGHSVSREKFLNALQHHQSLCGGTEPSLF